MTNRETIGALCTRHPLALPVLEQLGIATAEPAATIDACCAERGLSITAVIAAIVAAESELAVRWQNRTIEDLIDDVVRTFHRPFALEVSAVLRAFEAARDATGKAPWSVVIAELTELHADLAQHIEMEERVVFPWLRTRNTAAISTIRAMQLEHADAIAQLLAIETHARACVADDPANPHGVRALAGLHRFERWLCEHIHLESNTLFPRALEAARR